MRDPRTGKASVLGGLLMVLGGTAWMLFGLKFDRIFIIAPALVITGLIVVIRGMLRR